VTVVWTLKDRTGQLRTDVLCASRVDVGRRIVPGRYDPFRLEVSPSYRAMFERAVDQVLAREGWSIVRTRAPRDQALA
jgi:hypothetical protein